MPARSYWVETLGCPKNSVDSDKLTGRLVADGLTAADDPSDADVVVVNTCAFVEDARQESIEVILGLAEARRDGARLVVTGCLAERYGDELAAELPEVDAVVGFGHSLLDPATTPPPAGGAGLVPVLLRPRVGSAGPVAPDVPDFDLLNLPRPAATAPWAYVKVAEGCDRACGFCAIPSFRGPQRSRPAEAVLAEVDQLGAAEIVLVAQDLASYGRDQGVGERGLVPLLRQVADRVERVRLLYLYPSDLTDALVDAVCASGVPYFDLSLQHVSRPLLRRMRRWGDGDRFRARIDDIRRREPGAALRSNFIVGYPGETEDDHDALLRFVEEVELDWCGFFSYSQEDGTYAADLDGTVDPALMAERLAELRELQDAITERRRADLVGERVEVLVDSPGEGRTHREAPEIDGVVVVPDDLPVGEIASLVVTGAAGPDLHAERP
ncbi:MAG TPA: radical SAM protein [Acidimicrobiales bacterium]|nr:radical SAM protein [Acidimicrobiales bacterium]